MTGSYSKTIVCLANSRKPPEGRCVAGREISTNGYGDWVRAVSSRPTHELTLEERTYRNGEDPNVLDIISIEMTAPQPRLHQKENHVIDRFRRWEKKGVVTWKQLEAAVENHDEALWINGCSSYHGRNDRIPENSLENLTRSLYLIRTDRLILKVASEGDVLGPLHRRVRAGFSCAATLTHSLSPIRGLKPTICQRMMASIQSVRLFFASAWARFITVTPIN